MTKTINRVVQSEAHLRKLVQVLVKFILIEQHPEWSYRALTWLNHLLRSPVVRRKSLSPVVREALRPLLSHTNEVSGLDDIFMQAVARGSAVEKWAKGSASWSRGVPLKLFYGGLFDVPSTGYVFIDDSDDDSKQTHRVAQFGSKSNRTTKPESGESDGVSNSKLLGNLDQPTDKMGDEFPDDLDDLLDDDDLEDGEEDDDDDYEEDDLDMQFDDVIQPYESDHGVFDVNETASSEEQQAGVLRRRDVLSNQATTRSDLSADDASDATDSQDSNDSDEELNMLMWSRKDANDSSDSIDSELEDLRRDDEGDGSFGAKQTPTRPDTVTPPAQRRRESNSPPQTEPHRGSKRTRSIKRQNESPSTNQVSPMQTRKRRRESL